jgi:hypothetical protein
MVQSGARLGHVRLAGPLVVKEWVARLTDIEGWGARIWCSPLRGRAKSREYEHRRRWVCLQYIKERGRPAVANNGRAIF